MSETKSIAMYLLERRNKKLENAVFLLVMLVMSGVLIALGYIVWLKNAVDASNHASQITCVSGTVLQPDGSCMEQER